MAEHPHEAHGHHEHAPELPPGWNRPLPEHVPRPTYWPVVLALGVAFIFWGFLTSLLITAVGVVLLAIALGGWIGELTHED